MHIRRFATRDELLACVNEMLVPHGLTWDELEADESARERNQDVYDIWFDFSSLLTRPQAATA